MKNTIWKDRRGYIGGSDARIITGNDEAALVRLWQEKRGETEPEDLSGNLIVQLGLVTEDLNRRWYEANSGPGHRRCAEEGFASDREMARGYAGRTDCGLGGGV